MNPIRRPMVGRNNIYEFGFESGFRFFYAGFGARNPEFVNVILLNYWVAVHYKVHWPLSAENLCLRKSRMPRIGILFISFLVHIC